MKKKRDAITGKSNFCTRAGKTDFTTSKLNKINYERED